MYVRLEHLNCDQIYDFDILLKWKCFALLLSKFMVKAKTRVDGYWIQGQFVATVSLFSCSTIVTILIQATILVTGAGVLLLGVSSHFGEVPALHKTIIVLAL